MKNDITYLKEFTTRLNEFYINFHTFISEIKIAKQEEDGDTIFVLEVKYSQDPTVSSMLQEELFLGRLLAYCLNKFPHYIDDVSIEKTEDNEEVRQILEEQGNANALLFVQIDFVDENEIEEETQNEHPSDAEIENMEIEKSIEKQEEQQRGEI